MTEVRNRGVSWTRSTLSGVEVTKLMRRHRKTIGELSFRLGVSQKRLREVRDQGRSDPYAVRDWLEAIVGEDVGPLPTRYRIKHGREECSCGQCDYRREVGDLLRQGQKDVEEAFGLGCEARHERQGGTEFLESHTLEFLGLFFVDSGDRSEIFALLPHLRGLSQVLFDLFMDLGDLGLDLLLGLDSPPRPREIP